jgi:hypothetical protein
MSGATPREIAHLVCKSLGVTAEQVLAMVAEQHGLQLDLDGPCPGGEVGAYMARAGDGSRMVFKWSEDDGALPRLSELARVLELMRSDGYRLPRYGPVLFIPGGVFIAQQVMAGAWRDDITHALLDELFAANHLQANRELTGDGEPWGAFVVRTLVEGADGWCLHEGLREHSLRTRRLLGCIEEIGHGTDWRAIPSGDVVHLDFHHRNVLQTTAGELVAVIDWEGARSGDRVFDLVTLTTWIENARTDDGVEERIWSRITDLGQPQAVRAYVAHMALRQVDWTIRHHPDEADHWIEVAERSLRAHA